MGSLAVFERRSINAFLLLCVLDFLSELRKNDNMAFFLDHDKRRTLFIDTLFIERSWYERDSKAVWWKKVVIKWA